LVAGAATFVTYGLMYRRAELTLQHLASRGMDIRLPIALPLAVIAIARDIVSTRTAASAAKKDAPAAR
jgi:hypothetical protein